jgi:hypothetical protein
VAGGFGVTTTAGVSVGDEVEVAVAAPGDVEAVAVADPVVVAVVEGDAVAVAEPVAVAVVDGVADVVAVPVAEGVATWFVTAAVHRTTAPPPLPEPLHWSTFTGSAAVIVDSPVTVQA